ncbi:ABC transporter transmembrane domain-containing protein [Pseudohaliea rubra]|uniref:Toxin secretion ABC transporter ATP-binding protein n=1 Tax=Pseudohaliea rubra DSM 19751 TaxID=1265313 RepID=A0A095VS84_9GAMM|nr:ABC transporter ATP-binding protein [Pseudohaliea rubra]KGE03953.1 Toxin secretion ABC transporter ATP-binding protein [Pseudohaliea rubra DSM 19751]
MAESPTADKRSLITLFRYFVLILGPEHRFYTLTILYGIGISVLSVATPVSVQMLVNSVAATGLPTPLIVLALSLFGLLLIAGALRALRIYVMDVFGRRFYARLVSEISLRALYARNPHFEDNQKGPLFNRYFDIIQVMIRMPDILIGGFTIILQAAAGFVLTSFYHPFLLVFNLVIVALLWLVWLIWGPRAIRSAVELSHRKHVTAAFLEGLGKSNGFFKSARHIDDALERTDQVTGAYIEQHRHLFRQHFSQTLCFLFIYAAGSAALLGLGGWLVIEGQLSLGQLVAAELVLSVVLYGISQLGIYLNYFYYLCAAVDELSLFMQVEQERPEEPLHRLALDARLDFVAVRTAFRGITVALDCRIPAGARVCAYAGSHLAQRLFTELLKCHEAPENGYIALGDQDLRSLKVHEARQEIIVLDRPSAVETDIRDYLRLSADDEHAMDVMTAIRAVGLERSITELANGLDTPLVATGWPLSITETMQLKLAAALIACPRVLVLSQVYDAVPEGHLKASLDLLQARAGTTVIYFTNKHTDFSFTAWLHLGRDEQQLFDSYERLCDAMGFERLTLREPVEGHGMESSGTREGV